jgi:hypothetical protein
MLNGSLSLHFKRYDLFDLTWMMKLFRLVNNDDLSQQVGKAAVGDVIAFFVQIKKNLQMKNLLERSSFVSNQNVTFPFFFSRLSVLNFFANTYLISQRRWVNPVLDSRSSEVFLYIFKLWRQLFFIVCEIISHNAGIDTGIYFAL